MQFIKILNQINKEKIIKVIFFILLIIVTLNSLIYFFEKYIVGDRYIFFDLPLNYCAGKLFSNDISPYVFGLGKTKMIECVNGVINGDWGMPAYIYSPIFLEILSPISKFDFNTVKILWYFITILSIFLIIIFSYVVLPINSLKKIFPLIIFFSFGSILSSALFSGNISILGYSLLAMSLIFLHKKKLELFSFIIIVLTLIKPHFFIFLLIGFIVYGKEYIQYIVYSLLIILGCYLAFFIFKTSIFIDFVHALKVVNTKEWFFSYNSTFGLKGILNNFPTIFNNIFNVYYLSGPNIVNNIIWILFVFFIFLGLIYFRLFTKITNLNDENKSKLIAFGSIAVLLISPNLTTYDFLIYVPSVFYLVNKMKFNNKFKYFLMILFIIIHDINFPFFIASLIYFLVIFSTIKNRNILNLNN